MNFEFWNGELELYNDEDTLSDDDKSIMHLWGNEKDRIAFVIQEGFEIVKEDDGYGNEVHIVQRNEKKTFEHMQERMIVCNKLLLEISQHEREFFRNKGTGKVAKFTFKDQDLYYEDDYTLTKIHMSPELSSSPEGFSHGGSLWSLIKTMRDFIYEGNPKNLDSRHWGYNLESLKLIHAYAKELGFSETASFTLYDYNTSKDITYFEGEDE